MKPGTTLRSGRRLTVLATVFAVSFFASLIVLRLAVSSPTRELDAVVSATVSTQPQRNTQPRGSTELIPPPADRLISNAASSKEHPGETGPSDDASTSDKDGLRTFDTAWMMASQATDSEVDDYLQHIKHKGFDGAWFTVLPIPWADRGSQRYNFVNDGSDSPAYTVDDGNFVLTENYISRLNRILERSKELGLRHGLVVAWANEYLCSSSLRLDASNARVLGEQIASRLNHSGAVDYWVFGGDQGSSADRSCLDDSGYAPIWAAFEAGLRANGAHQDVAYHTAPIDWVVQLGQAVTHIDQPWLQVFAPQSGHGGGAEKVTSDIGQSVSRSNGKPVFAAELTYFMFDCFDLSRDCPGTTGSAEMIRSETAAAISSGATGILYGDWDRWLWCTPLWPAGDRSTPCDGSIYNTFNTAGEEAFFKAVDQFS